MEDTGLVHRAQGFFSYSNLFIPLVKTGKYRVGDEVRPDVVPPDEVFNSFAEFIDSLLSDRISKL